MQALRVIFPKELMYSGYMNRDDEERDFPPLPVVPVKLIPECI